MHFLQALVTEMYLVFCLLVTSWIPFCVVVSMACWRASLLSAQVLPGHWCVSLQQRKVKPAARILDFHMPQISVQSRSTPSCYCSLEFLVCACLSFSCLHVVFLFISLIVLFSHLNCAEENNCSRKQWHADNTSLNEGLGYEGPGCKLSHTLTHTHIQTQLGANWAGHQSLW